MYEIINPKTGEVKATGKTRESAIGYYLICINQWFAGNAEESPIWLEHKKAGIVQVRAVIDDVHIRGKGGR